MGSQDDKFLDRWRYHAMFLLKKFFSRFLFPLPLSLEVLTIGLLLLLFTRKQKTGKALVALAAVLVVLFSSNVFSGRLLTPLESHYPPLFLTPGAPVPEELRQAKFVVVLGSGSSGNTKFPPETQLDDASTARLVEGVRVSKMLHCCKLILSGGPTPKSGYSVARDMGLIAEELGVSREDLIIDAQSRDTEEQAQRIAAMVGQQPFILVTEASHMPRAVALFRKQGAHPIADPMGSRIERSDTPAPDRLFPDAEALRGSQRAIYEYLGLAWAKVRGQI